ncbi:hypothetical protein DW928_06960 [Firmicutes bacterium AM43-11BH]|nr:hypothetical protein DW928_06960 [Firmicutes bacterium AM43-11BH]
MEIGSIFEIDISNLFKEPLQEEIEFPFMKEKKYYMNFYNTGRAAIESLFCFLKNSQGRTRVLLPTYNCDSVYEAVERTQIMIELYPINRDFTINIDALKSFQFSEGDIFYIVQYFGKKISKEALSFIQDLKTKGVLIIEDISLCLLSYSETIGIGDYIVGSIRKWFALPDGGFCASTYDMHDLKKEQAANNYTFNYMLAQLMKQKYLQDNSLDKTKFLKLNKMGMDTLFSDYKIREMSEVSIQLMKSSDVRSIISIREDNYRSLWLKLAKIPQVTVMIPWEVGIIPLGMVIAVEDRDRLYDNLIKNDIYCNIHWRTNRCMDNSEEAIWLSKHCLTIPCDQRYSNEHMKRIEKVICNYFEVKNV